MASAKDDDPWADLASHYFTIAQNPSFQTSDAFLSDLHALRPFSTASAVLDSGCGPGMVLLRLFAGYDDVLPAGTRFVAADSSKAMVEQVRKRVEGGVGRWGAVEARVCDAMDLQGVESGSLSHVTAGFVYFMVSAPGRALAESLRVLEVGGALGCSSWKGSEWIELMEVLLEVRPDKEMMAVPAGWRSAAGVEAELREAGFREVRARELEVEMSYDDPSDMCTFILEKLPHMKGLIQDMPRAEVEEVHRRMVEKLVGGHGKGKGRMKGTSISAVGKK